MIIRQVLETDADDYFDMLCRLDEETEYMMYEPGERKARTKDPEFLRSRIKSANECGDLLLAAFGEDGKPVGFISAERGKPNRIRHTAYIVVGILRDYRRRGIGTEFFERTDRWARECGIFRLELTVECENTAALALYEKSGFVKEGLRPKSTKVGGRFVDEFYMGKIIE